MAAVPLPRMGALAMARALFKRRRRGAAQPFSTEYTLDALDPAQLRRYNRLLGFGDDALPVSYYYLLAQRAHLPTLLDARFPFRVAGMVHVENDVVEQRRWRGSLPLRLVTDVRVDAPRANGAILCHLMTRAADADGPVFACTSTYLAVRGNGQGARAAAEVIGDAAPLGTWRLDATSGRAYAAVSGDWNPIHLWRWSARLFGLRAPIIHGMHTIGTACALLEQAGGRRVSAVAGRFRSPAPLGAALTLMASADGGVFTVRSGERVVVEGRCAFERPST